MTLKTREGEGETGQAEVQGAQRGLRAITVEAGLKPEEQIRVTETKRAANREMRRDTRKKGDQQSSKKSSTAELEK